MDWQLTCRVCLENGDMVSLFDWDENNEQLSDKYSFCCGIQVSKRYHTMLVAMATLIIFTCNNVATYICFHDFIVTSQNIVDKNKKLQLKKCQNCFRLKKTTYCRR